MKILVMNSVTFKMPIQQDENTGNNFYYIKDPILIAINMQLISYYLYTTAVTG